MSEDTCMWCGKTYKEHLDRRGPNDPVPKMPCTGLKAYFLTPTHPKPSTQECECHCHQKCPGGTEISKHLQVACLCYPTKCEHCSGGGKESMNLHTEDGECMHLSTYNSTSDKDIKCCYCNKKLTKLEIRTHQLFIQMLSKQSQEKYD